MRKITLFILMLFITISISGQNKLLSSIDEYYNGLTWENNSGFNYEYDSNDNLIAETYYGWNNVTWEMLDKTQYTYNVNNRVTQAIYQNWNATTNEFENSFRSSYTYTNGKITEVNDEEWINSNWVNDYKIVATYNSNNLPDTIIYYNWENSQWVNDERETYTYNSNNTISSEIDQEWISSQWVNSFKSIYSYNSNNKLISDRGANWDVFNNIWVEAGANRTDYEWDATGNRIRRTESGNYDYREEYTYNGSQFMNSFVHPFKDKTGLDYLLEGFPYVNKVLTTNGYNYNPNTSNYEINSRTTYNYNSSITLGTEKLEIADKNMTVYPNPSKDFLYIQTPSNTEIDKITVTDLSGKIILKYNQNSTQIDVQKLSKGMYLLQVLSGKEKFQTKFIKE